MKVIAEQMMGIAGQMKALAEQIMGIAG